MYICICVQAKTTLDRTNLFPNCCELQIEYSKRDFNLKVKKNNETSRDYTISTDVNSPNSPNNPDNPDNPCV